MCDACGCGWSRSASIGRRGNAPRAAASRSRRAAPSWRLSRLVAPARRFGGRGAAARSAAARCGPLPASLFSPHLLMGPLGLPDRVSASMKSLKKPGRADARRAENSRLAVREEGGGSGGPAFARGGVRHDEAPNVSRDKATAVAAPSPHAPVPLGSKRARAAGGPPGGGGGVRNRRRRASGSGHTRS